MKTFGLAALSLVALTTSALSADMPLKARPMIPEPVWSWTGFYVGGSFGGGFFPRDNSVVSFQRFTGAGGAVPHPLQLGTQTNRRNAFLFGGAQAGYNLQLNQFLIGIETDFSWANAGRERAFPAVGEGPAAFNVTGTDTLEWFGTVRGRAGILVGTWLAYATGGLAYARTTSVFTGVVTGPGPLAPFNLAQSSARTNTGWVGGGGVEYPLSPKASIKLEYQHIQLDGQLGAFVPTTVIFNGGNRATVSVSPSNMNRFDTIRLGANIRF